LALVDEDWAIVVKSTELKRKFVTEYKSW